MHVDVINTLGTSAKFWGCSGIIQTYTIAINIGEAHIGARAKARCNGPNRFESPTILIRLVLALI